MNEYYLDIDSYKPCGEDCEYCDYRIINIRLCKDEDITVWVGRFDCNESEEEIREELEKELKKLNLKIDFRFNVDCMYDWTIVQEGEESICVV
jgi:hypothetical protein